MPIPHERIVVPVGRPQCVMGHDLDVNVMGTPACRHTAMQHAYHLHGAFLFFFFFFFFFFFLI